MKTNYQLACDRIIDRCKEETSVKGAPSLCLHSCCAPCSSYTLEYLSQYFEITVFYYNPNITNSEEYQKRVEEQRRLIKELPTKYAVHFQEGIYDPESFLQVSKGLEQCPEGGKRCRTCYELRLRETARVAKEKGFDFFTTTLSISPHKNATWLNEIGEVLSQEFGIFFLPTDLKKRGGYQRSIELSREYNLYRQNYCGCEFSRMQSEARKGEE